MFVPLEGQTTLGVSPDQVVAVISSVNTPNISAGPDGTEPARAYIVGVQLPTGGYSVALYLHFLQSNRPLIYRPEPLSFGLDIYPQVEAAGIQFVESMGFMLENLNFRAQSNEDASRLINNLPFFHELPPPVAEGTELSVPDELPAVSGSVISTSPLDEGDTEVIGRLLGSF